MFICSTALPSTTLVTFNQSTYNVNENAGLVQPVLLLNMSLSTDITIQVTSVDVTATGKYTVYTLNKQHVNSSNVTGGVDYHSGPYNITFPAGMTIMPFNVSIYNDTILEGDEQFTLNINNATLPNNIITNSSSRATMIIRDDDSKFSLHKKYT